MCGGRGIAPKTDGIAVDCRVLPFVSDVLKSRGTADSGGENRRREQPKIANREDKSDAQRNRELRNYESNGEHSITSGPRTQAAGGHARSSTVFPVRIAGSTTQQSLRSVRPAVAAIVFHHNQTRPSHVDARSSSSRVRIAGPTWLSPARNSNSEVIPGRSDHAVSSCLSTIHQESPEKGWPCRCSCRRIQSVLVPHCYFGNKTAFSPPATSY